MLNYPRGAIDSGPFQICVTLQYDNIQSCGNGYNSEEKRPETVSISFSSAPATAPDKNGGGSAQSQSQSQTTIEELSGIFNVLMNALRNILKHKEIFTNDKTIEERRVKYQSAVDPVQGFLEVAINKESTETSYTTKTAAYEAFLEYCRIHRLPVRTKDAFGKSMKKKHNIEDDFATVGGKRPRVWKGIRLTSEYEDLVQKALIGLQADQKQKTIDGIDEIAD